MKTLATALGILLATALSANAAETKKESTVQVKSKAPMVVVHRNVGGTTTAPKKLHKKQNITPEKSK